MARTDTSGPVMLAATSVLTPPKARIGTIGSYALPRTIPLANAIALAISAVFGLVIGAPLGGITGWVVATGVIGAAVVALMNFSPLRGESITQWLLLSARARRQTVVMEGGERVRVYVGSCPVDVIETGPFFLVPGAVPVATGSVDERGAFRHTPELLADPEDDEPARR